jgi:AcrR family transcriptional regulator
MSRPSTQTDERLIAAARALLPKTGFSRLTLREVAKKAGVNLGMFSYHFKNKQQFVHRVMGQMYEEFLAQFNLEAATGATPLERLRNALRALGRFARDNRDLLAALARDLMDGNRDTIRFIENNFNRHVAVIYRLVRQCRRDGSMEKTISIPVALSFIAAGVAAPAVMVSVIERAPTGILLTSLKKATAPLLLSNRAVERRIEMALQAVSPRSTPRNGETLPAEQLCDRK